MSLSAVLAEMAARGLAQIDDSVELEIDDVTGFPLLRLGRAVTSEDVADALDE